MCIPKGKKEDYSNLFSFYKEFGSSSVSALDVLRQWRKNCFIPTVDYLKAKEIAIYFKVDITGWKN